MYNASITINAQFTDIADFAKLFAAASAIGTVGYATFSKDGPPCLLSSTVSSTQLAEAPAEKPKATRAKKETAPASPPADASSAAASSTPSTAPAAAPAAAAPSEPAVDIVALRALITAKIEAAASNRLAIQDLVKAYSPDGKLSSVPADKHAEFRGKVEAL